MPAGNVTIEPVDGRGDLRKFIKLPWFIYKGYPHWVPPLIVQVKAMLDREKHPFYHNAECELFLARRDGRVVGRIAAIINKIHNRTHNESTCFFGFFESIDDRSVSEALLGRAAEWGRSRGMDLLRGPMNPSVHYEIGLLTKGFDSPPMVMMTYNPEYYVDHVEGFGFEKVRDLYAYTRSAVDMPERMARIIESFKNKSGVELRSMDMKSFGEEAKKIQGIYNKAWDQNWGMVPISGPEFEHLALDLKKLVEPDFVLFAEVAGQPVGFIVVMPNINEALARLNGRLFPTGLLKLLWYSRKIKSIRVPLMGIIPEYRKARAIAPLFYERMFEVCREQGFTWGELSWILEDNADMVRYLEKLGAQRAKTYTIYDLKL
ncbi:GNAT family N-acetyltransferase [candidate division KSB1 bacterium]